MGQHGEELVLAVVLFQEHALGTLLRGNVLADAGHAIEDTSRIGDRECARADLTYLAIASLEPEFRIHMAVAQHRIEGGFHALAVLGVHAGEPKARVVLEVFHRTRPELGERRAHEQELALGGVQDPQRIGEILGQLAEQFLVFAQGLR